MTSLFIDSSTRTDGDNYRIPTKIEFTGVKLRSAIILNNSPNVIGFQVIMHLDGANPVVTIDDGYYTGSAMATYLQNKLNQVVPFNGQIWGVSFNEASNKFTFSYDNPSSTFDAGLTFNTASQSFFGVTTMTFPQNVLSYVESLFPSISKESFYRIESQTLSSVGYMEHDSPNSGLLAIVPIEGGWGSYSKYENPDNFFLKTTSVNDIYNYIQINVFLGDSKQPLVNPSFALTFQFQ